MRALLILSLLATAGPPRIWTPPAETVVILHGLARDAASMSKLEEVLAGAGFATRNLDYPSTGATPAALVAQLRAEVEDCCAAAPRVHFVTHSLGGLLVRAYLAETPPSNLGRVVMLAPPNHGSEIVDLLGGVWPFSRLFGPTAAQLGTSPLSFPNRLPEPDYEVGIIAGDRPVNPLGAMAIPGSDDGGVSLEGAKLERMKDFLAVHESHSRIMRSPQVADQVLSFLYTGCFFHRSPPAARTVSPSCRRESEPGSEKIGPSETEARFTLTYE